MNAHENDPHEASVTPKLPGWWGCPPDLLSDNRWQEYLLYGVPLYQAALRGNWEAARSILHSHPLSITARITRQGDTVLHVAAAARKTHFVIQLVNYMISKNKITYIDDLALQNKVGNTALCLAAASGTVRIAEVMVKAHRGLPLIRGHSGLTPLHMAALFGHREMTWYLWRLIRDGDHLTDKELIALFISTLKTVDLHDVALYMLQQHPGLATARDEHQRTPLHVLARKSGKGTGSKPGFCRRFYELFGSKCGGYTEDTLQLVEDIWVEVKRRNQDEISVLLTNPWRLLFKAVQEGNVEFLTILIRSYPDLLWKVDENRRSIFHVAVIYRQEEIFRLIYEIGAIKDLLAAYTDDEENSMLHLAAMLPSSDRLNCISGAALQMQREMLWFKEIEDLVQPQFAEAKNTTDKKTPRELFTEQHQELRKKGEEWMAKTASSCSVVASLIASVVFGASWKVSSDLTSSSVHGTLLYWLFAICDGLSLISSTASILMFLSILTSSYAEEDFRISLPFKLMIGLTLLFISISNMMIAFTVAFSIIFKHSFLFVGTILASIPIILFGIQIFPLLRDVYSSTIGRNSIFKPRHLLFPLA